MELLTSLHGKVCHRNDCTEPLQYKESFVGTCFVVSWTCGCGHLGGRWASQPTCEDVRAGNLLLASAIALSGNSFTKVGFLFKIYNIAFFSKSLFNQYQYLYIALTINEHWKKVKLMLGMKEQENHFSSVQMDAMIHLDIALSTAHIALLTWRF